MASITEAIAYNDHATEQGAIGFLKYGPESQRADDHSPETCYASVALKPECFCTLLSALQAGRLPKSIHIEAKGMEFGWKPDGSGVVWNVNSASTLPIVDIRFNVPLIADLQPLTPSSPFEIPVVSDRHPSTTYDIKSLERTLISVLQKLETRFSRIGVSVIAVAVLLLLFRH
jgi:hypothetical protein